MVKFAFNGVTGKLDLVSTSGDIDHGGLTGLGDDDHNIYILASGARVLTGNWDAGSFQIRAETFQSDVATGTSPFTVASTTKVTNLNADLLDDQTGSYYLDLANVTGTLAVASGGTNISSYSVGDLLYASGATTLAKLADVATGQVLISGGVGVAPSWSGSPFFSGLVDFDGGLKVATTKDIYVYNTADETTNYERWEVTWSDSDCFFGTNKGGSGTQREWRLKRGSRNLLYTTSTGGGDLHSGWDHWFDNGISMGDDSSVRFGAGGDARFYWSTSQTNDAFLINTYTSNSAAQSGNMIFCDTNNVHDYALAAHAHVNIYIMATHATENDPWMRLTHDYTNAILETGKGNLNLDPFGNVALQDNVLIQRDTNAGLTASTTQTQGQGALTAEVNEVATCTNANDTVTLPTAVAGLRIVIINNGAQTLRIFPASGDNLGVGVDTATTLASGSNVVYQSYNDTNWEVI